MASAVTVIRNMSFVGFVGGAAVLAMPYLANPVARTNAVSSILHPTELTAPAPQPSRTVEASPPPVVSAPPQIVNPAPPPSATDGQTDNNSETAPPATDQQPNNESSAPSQSDTEFGPDEPAALALEKQLVESRATPGIYPEEDAVVLKTIVCREGPGLNYPVKHLVHAAETIQTFDMEAAWSLVGANETRDCWLFAADLRRPDAGAQQ